MSEPILSVRELTKHFAGVTAVNKVSFDLHAEEVVGLIGPNGAGKTTVINLLTGFATVNGGSMRFRGHDATQWPTHRRVHAGLTRTFQSPIIFAPLTVVENVHAAALSSMKLTTRDHVFRSPSWRRADEEARAQAEELIAFTGLESSKESVAGELAYGHRKVLGIALGLATRPDVLLMDEPTAGLSPGEREDVAALLRRIPGRGTSALVVEHDMKLIMNCCDRIVVLNYGHKIAEGGPDAVRNDPQVIEAYLGGASDDAS